MSFSLNYTKYISIMYITEHKEGHKWHVISSNSQDSFEKFIYILDYQTSNTYYKFTLQNAFN